MKFSVTSEAAQWFIKELDLKPGGAVKIFTKIYGGIPTVYPSFFLGIAPGNKDDESTAKTVVDDITFYIESGNEWIVDNHDLTVEYNGQDVDYRFSN